MKPDPPGRYVVLCTKANGRDFVFTRCASWSDAELVAAKLVAIGCVARAARAQRTDILGLSRRRRTAELA